MMLTTEWRVVMLAMERDDLQMGCSWGHIEQAVAKNWQGTYCNSWRFGERIRIQHVTNFTFVWPRIVTNFFIINPTRCTNFTNLFRHENLHISDSSSVHHQDFTHCTLSNGIQVCRQLLNRTRMELQFHPGSAQKLSTNLYDIYHCWAYSEYTPDDEQKNCPKLVEFHAEINLWN